MNVPARGLNPRPAQMLWFLLACAACPTATEPPDNEFVVEGFLYAGQPVDSILITASKALGDTDTVATPITNATVIVSKAGIDYQLASVGGGYYSYPGADLTVNAGDIFQLRATAGGLTATAQTSVPYPPDSVTESSGVITVSLTTSGFGGRRLTGDSIRIGWTNAAAQYYYVTLESLDSAAIQIATSTRFSGRFRLITQPTTSDYYEITPQQIRVLGNHVAKVYRVNKEYADLYANRMQDSRDLNEPPTNISGGLGIFTAFNLQRVYFTVVEP